MVVIDGNIQVWVIIGVNIRTQAAECQSHSGNVQEDKEQEARVQEKLNRRMKKSNKVDLILPKFCNCVFCEDFVLFSLETAIKTLKHDQSC